VNSRLKSDAGSPLDALRSEGLGRVSPGDVDAPYKVYFTTPGSRTDVDWDTLVSDGFTAKERAVILEVLDDLVAITGQGYEITTNPADADVQFLKSHVKNGRSFAETPFLYDGADKPLVVLNNDAEQWTPTSIAPGGYMRMVIAHEVGHALGLAHPHDLGGGSTLMAGQARGPERDFGLGQAPAYGDELFRRLVRLQRRTGR